ncbi:hypothetical protein NMY22_g1571 [Coprinellus aureogranulatus]|nr:hypothetical protein NMY22_g1571 [Coprinellus aureogranulatus]
MDVNAPALHDASPPSNQLEILRSPSFFSGAHGFRIDQQTNVVHNHAGVTDIFSLLNPIPDASFARDRKVSPPDSSCLPGTRQALIKQIQSWIDGNTLLKAQHVMWIYGYVGCGKSSIAQAIAEVYSRKKRLVASFFFFRGSGERCKSRRFAATVAGQLAAAIPAAAPHLERAIRTHTGLLTTYPLSAQFEHLVYRPLKAFLKANPLRPSFLRDPYLIVLDGLDECEDSEELAEFVEHMLEFFNMNPRIPLRFLITSRVEEHLRARLGSPQVHLLNLVDHTTLEDVSEVVHATFALASKLDRVVQAYGSWPSPEERQTLVRHSGGSLVFISTLLKFILGSSTDGLTPMERLPLALKINPGLDGLYRQTLSRSLRLPHFFDIITVLVTSTEPPTIFGLAELLEIRTFEVIRVLVNLHAILHVPGDDQTPITICHTSLRDFLEDESRSAHLYISQRLKEGLYKRFLSRHKNESGLRMILATLASLSEPLSAIQLGCLLGIPPDQIMQPLVNASLVFHAHIDTGACTLGPSALLPSFREFIELEVRSRGPHRAHQRLAFHCFAAILHPHLSHTQVAKYAQEHAIEHWTKFLQTVPFKVDSFRSLGNKALSYLRQTSSPSRIVDAVLVLLSTIDDLNLQDCPSLPLKLLAKCLGMKEDQVFLIPEAVSVLVQYSGQRSIKDVKPDFMDDIYDMDYEHLEAVVASHLALLSILDNREIFVVTQDGEPPLPSVWDEDI